jgi:hypothetical protein
MFAAGMAMIVGCATPLVIDSVQQGAAAQAQRQVDSHSADELQLARELPGTPPDVVAAFVDLLAEGGSVAAQETCLMFSTQAATRFAADHHALNCVAAVQQLQAQVTDPDTYANQLSVPDTAWTQVGSTTSLNGCALSWSDPFSDTSTPAPGPLPGLWTLVQLDGEGWQITSYEPC